MQKIGPFLLFITMLTSGICWRGAGGGREQERKKKKYMLCNRILLKSYLPFLAKLKKKSLLAANKHRHRIIRRWRRRGTVSFASMKGFWMNCCCPESLLFPQLPPSLLRSLPSGYSQAREFALPCGHPACCLPGFSHTSTGRNSHLLAMSARCLVLKRQAWRGLRSKRHGSHPKADCPTPETALPEGSPGSPPGPELRSPNEVGFAPRKSSNLPRPSVNQNNYRAGQILRITLLTGQGW